MSPSSVSRAFASLLFFVVAACGGGGGGTAAPPAFDLTGQWKLYLTPQGGAEVGPLPLYLAQNGAAFDGISVTGSMSGASFNVTADAVVFVVMLSGTASSDSMATGNVTFSGGVVGSGTFRLEKFQATGTMSVMGTLDGNTISETSSIAAGMRSYSDIGLSTLSRVSLVIVNPTVDIQIELAPANLAVGTLAVPGTVSVDVVYRTDTALVTATATGGIVTVTQYDNSGIAGSYSLTTGADTITGSFALSFDIESYDP